MASSFKSKDTVKFTRAGLHTLQRTGIDHSSSALIQLLALNPAGLFPPPPLQVTLFMRRGSEVWRQEEENRANLFKSPSRVSFSHTVMGRKVTKYSLTADDSSTIPA